MTNGTSAPDPERRPGEDRAAQIERELIQFLAAVSEEPGDGLRYRVRPRKPICTCLGEYGKWHAGWCDVD